SLGVSYAVQYFHFQRLREYPRDPLHVLRSGTGEFVDLPQMRPGVEKDGGDYPSDIGRGDRRGLAAPERQFDAASVADGRTGEREKGVEEHRWPDGDDWQAGPSERLFAEP